MKLSIDRNQFLLEMKQRGIGGSVHFIPIPNLSFFSRWAGLPQNQCPRAQELYSRSVSLPLYPAMTQEQVAYVAKTVMEIAQRSRKVAYSARASGAA
jgi:dTDP-4-amino-4,6-dideoxygalactose transaminase